MDYNKVTFSIKPDNQDFRDILMASLGEVGFESFVENDSNVEAYIPSNITFIEKIDVLDFDPLFVFQYKNEIIPEQNWNEIWEKNYFQPLVIANKCVVRAPFHTDYPKLEFEIVIEPKMAFGTGNHETTSLMIEHLLELDIANKKVLDMGCGTGILAILSSMLGAKKVTAIDIDKWSYEATCENSLINKCNNITAHIGNSSILGNESFDLILANIHKNVLIDDMARYNNVLILGGTLIMSGFYEHDLTDIKHVADSLNLKMNIFKTRNKWVAVSFTK
ncbi:MAG TPA: 50S ribosomal protein L11 methyltransferase [Prolixibacteraceae bacterium]|nr:50S ribosomal protein L11 methyltransferase [Prolixibacteraceae bacterium]